MHITNVVFKTRQKLFSLYITEASVDANKTFSIHNVCFLKTAKLILTWNWCSEQESFKLKTYMNFKHAGIMNSWCDGIDPYSPLRMPAGYGLMVVNFARIRSNESLEFFNWEWRQRCKQAGKVFYNFAPHVPAHNYLVTARSTSHYRPLSLKKTHGKTREKFYIQF